MESNDLGDYGVGNDQDCNSECEGSPVFSFLGTYVGAFDFNENVQVICFVVFILRFYL